MTSKGGKSALVARTNSQNRIKSGRQWIDELGVRAGSPIRRSYSIDVPGNDREKREITSSISIEKVLERILGASNIALAIFHTCGFSCNNDPICQRATSSSFGSRFREMKIQSWSPKCIFNMAVALLGRLSFGVSWSIFIYCFVGRLAVSFQNRKFWIVTDSVK